MLNSEGEAYNGEIDMLGRAWVELGLGLGLEGCNWRMVGFDVLKWIVTFI